MFFHEYGKGNKKTVILLHGGGLSWWNYREAAELLKDEYHLILPVLDGHADSDRPFTSIEDNAAEIISHVDKYCDGKVTLIGGLSLGAQILVEILSQRNDICEHALIESADVLPSRLTNALIGPAFGSSYGLIKNRNFARLQFRSLHIKDDLFEDYYRDTCLISKENMISFMKANTSYSLKDSFSNVKADVQVYYGDRETGEIRRSAQLITDRANGTLHCLKGLNHGEFSLNYPVRYAEDVKTIINNEI